MPETTKNTNVSKLKDLGDKSTSLLFGNDSKLTDENKAILDNIQKAIAVTRQSFSDYTGESITDFFNSLEYDNISTKKKKDKNAKDHQVKNSKDLINSNTIGMAQNILANESGRLTLYENYEVLISYIPVLGKAAEAYVDAIISPDSYIDNSLAFSYEGSEPDSNIYKTVVGNLDNLKENYDLDSKLVDIVTNALIYGDDFYAVLSLSKEYTQILKEQNDSYILKENMLSSTDDILTESEVVGLNELYSEFLEDTSSKKQQIDWNNEINKLINENIEFSDDINSITFENLVLNESFNASVKPPRSNSTGGDITKMMMGDVSSPYTNGKDVDGKNGKLGKNDSIEINGSILKHLDRKRIIKIFNDGITYGYYYIEDSSKESDKLTSSETLTGIFSHNFRSSKHMDVNEQNNKLKKKIIIDIFAKKLAKRVNKQFLADNQEFKNTIYNLLNLNYITKKKVKIVYLSPDEVCHFYPKLQSDGYGQSILKNSLFLGMIYVSTLMTTLMMKMIRSPQKRVFYVETGLEEDYEAVVNDFVKNLKTSDMKIMGKDINTVLNSIGAFHDVVIPKIDGNAPIEFDTMDGLDANLSDDFLEYLQNAVVDSTGVPASFIQASAEVDFSRELSMQNSKFVRKVSTYKKVLNPPLNKLLRSLYYNEYKNKDKHLDLVELNKIFVDLPSPMSLMLNTFNDQISSAKDLIDFVATTYVGEDDDSNKELKKAYSMKLVKEFVPSIDWERMEELYREAKNESKVESIKNKLSTNSTSNGDGGDTEDPDL